MTKPLSKKRAVKAWKIGDWIEPYGALEAILWLGERYFLLNDGGHIALIPASTVPPKTKKA